MNWRHLVETLPTAKVEEMRMQSAGYCIVILLRLVWRKRIFTQGTPDKDAVTASLPKRIALRRQGSSTPAVASSIRPMHN